MNFAPIPSDTKENQLTNLQVNSLKKIVSLTLGGLDKALKFIDKNELNNLIKRMDYILYLTGYFIFFDEIHDTQEVKLIEWVKNIKFTNKSNGERRKIFDELLNIIN